MTKEIRKEHGLNGTLRKLTPLNKFEIDSNLEGKDLVDHLEALVEQGESGSLVVAQLRHSLPISRIGLQRTISHLEKSKLISVDLNIPESTHRFEYLFH